MATGGRSDYSLEQMDESRRKTLAPWQVSLYAPAPTTGISIIGSQENKVAITVIPPAAVVPNGFDSYTTPQGPAIRFIGSGLGNGDSGIFSISLQSTVNATSGAVGATFKCLTRPYTETDFGNATVLEGCFIDVDIPNNTEDIYILNAPLVSLSDGDLVELSIYPNVSRTISIVDLAVTILEIN